MTVIGIDLGTTNSLAVVWKGENYKIIKNVFGEELTPSVVSLDEKTGEVIVGKIAKERLITHPELTVKSFKRYMGTDKKIKLGDKLFRPEEISSFVIRKLKDDAEKYLNEEVTEAIISVPAYFNDYQRNATKTAGELAGLIVDRIINEPSAAALAYKLENDIDEANFLVFDFGGGTLDVSVIGIMDNLIEVVAISGDNHLGGDDFNNIIANEFLKINNLRESDIGPKKMAILIKNAEKCKIELSNDINAIVCIELEINGKKYNMNVNNKKLIEISTALFVRMDKPIKRVLKDSQMSLNDIDNIILVGGSSKMPIVREYIKYLIGKEPLSDIDPDKLVAIGVGIESGIKNRSDFIKDVVLTDVCPFSLGVEAYHNENLCFSPIIERNSILPTSKVNIYNTICDNQETILFKIYQGENYRVENNIKLGELRIKIPKNLKGKESVSVRFTYDINGLLEIEATVLSTNKKYFKTIISNGSKMTESEITEKLEELKKYKINPKDKEENRLIIEKGERLFEENVGEIREYIGSLLSYFNKELNTNNDFMIAKARKALESKFKEIDEL